MEGLLLVILTTLKIIGLMIALLLTVAFYTLAERKVLGYMHVRIGPNRVGPFGLFQPFADLIKLLTKEIIVPTASSKFLYVIAPAISIGTAFAAWVAIPFDKGAVLSDINAGVLFVLAITSAEVYAVIIAGWASNSKYAMLGGLRACAQTISYEIAMGFALVGVMMEAGSMNFQAIVSGQSGGIWHWYVFPLFPLFLVYWISAVAETNRAPFDMPEGEAEIVAGFHVEYSGMMFALFFLSEYANMLLVSALGTLMFAGGWLSPFQGIFVLDSLFAWVPGIVWFLAKLAFFAFCYLWFRATFPRYRYDQIMRLGWKVLIPVTLLWIPVVALMVQYKIGPWF